MDALPSIDKIIDITLNSEDAAKLREYFQKRLQQAGDTITLSEKEEIYSQEIIDFIAFEQIRFYGHFDWKSESTELDGYVKSAIKKNIDSSLLFESNCNLKEQHTVAHAVMLCRRSKKGRSAALLYGYR